MEQVARFLLKTLSQIGKVKPVGTAAYLGNVKQLSTQNCKVSRGIFLWFKGGLDSLNCLLVVSTVVGVHTFLFTIVFELHKHTNYALKICINMRRVLWQFVNRTRFFLDRSRLAKSVSTTGGF